MLTIECCGTCLYAQVTNMYYSDGEPVLKCTLSGDGEKADHFCMDYEAEDD